MNVSGNRGGWVAVHRALLDSKIWQLPDGQRIVYVTLLLLANHAATTWTWRGQQYSARPGQLVTSSEKIAAAAGVTRQTVRTALKNLAQLGILTNESTKSGMLITLTNWGSYQSGGEKSTNESTNDQPTNTATYQRINQRTAKNQPTDQPTNNSPKPLTIGACTNRTGKNQPTDQPSNGEKSTNISTTNNNTNNDIYNNNNNRTTAGPVDNLTTRLRLLLGTAVAQRWLTDPQYGPDYCRAQLGYVDSKGDVTSARAYVQAALVGNYADWKRPAPKPDPHCPKCGGTGRATTWVDAGNGALDGHAHLCTCVPRPALQQQPQHQAAAPDDPDHRDTAALAARVAAARTP